MPDQAGGSSFSISAIIVAAGRSSRFGGESKVFHPIGGIPCIQWSLEAHARCPAVRQVIVVGQASDEERMRDVAARALGGKEYKFAEGGDQRQDSVAAGLAAVAGDADLVSIHDAARPGVTPVLIMNVAERAGAMGAAVAAVPARDTLKEVGPDGRITATLDRSRIWQMATPQVFRRGLIERAYAQASRDGFVATDDAALVERLGEAVEVVEADESIRKVTTKLDAQALEGVLGQFETRVGFGYDVHRTDASRELWLGGVSFPEGPGLLGHSDADVVCHAAADAVLGAAAEGDIGRLFPDTDPQFKGARSTDLLRRVGETVRESGWEVVNLDVTLIAERPKIARRAGEMQAAIAASLEVDAGRVSIKATTAEGAGPVGEGLTMEAHAVAMLRRQRRRMDSGPGPE